MNNFRNTLNSFAWALSICLIISACGRKSEFPQGIEHVVVIGLDGLSATGLHAANAPTMKKMALEGAYSYTVRCILPTVSTPNWNAMLCGVGPEATGATNNSWNADDFTFPYPVMSSNHSFPNIFRIIREQRPQAELGSIYEWGDFRKMLEADMMNHYENGINELETAQKCAEYIVAKKPTFLFIQFDNIDHVGHSAGHMTPKYIESIEEADTHVKIVVDAIAKAGITDKTLVMVVGDHGGIRHGHGGNSYDELVTPMIFCGKGIKKNYQIRQTIYKYDVAANVTFALGLKAPYVWTGRPTRPAFVGFDEPDNLWTGVEVLPTPRFVNEAREEIREAKIDGKFTVTILPAEGTNGEIRYTLDGTTPTKESAVYKAPFELTKAATVTAKMFAPNGESVKEVLTVSE